MELKWVEAFVTLSKYLNFNKAAASMYITQPALSKYIAALEEEVGGRLFIRNRRKVDLTDIGRAILPKAVQILELVNETTCFARAAVLPEQNSPIRIAVDQYLDYRDCTSNGLFSFVKTFRHNHPAAEFEFSYVSYKKMNAQLLCGAVDIGFSIVYTSKFENIEASRLCCMPLLKDKMVMVVPCFAREAFDNGIPIHEIFENLKLLSMDGDTEFIIERLKSLKTVGITAQSIACSSWNEILMRANLGEGVFLLSENTARRSVSPMQIITFEELGYDEPVFHVALWKQPASSSVDRFVSELSTVT